MDKKFDAWDIESLDKKAIEAEEKGDNTNAALYSIASALRCISFDLSEIREGMFPDYICNDCVNKEKEDKDFGDN